MHKSVKSLAVLVLSASIGACGSYTETQPQNGAASAPISKKLNDEEKLALLATLPAPYNEGDLENGRRVYARCKSCHTLAEGAPNMTGPNLYGIFGRQVGTHQKYRYSKAVQNADFVWDAAKLDDWLKRPADFLPGNKMSFVGIAGEQDRRDIIAYLKLETGFTPDATGTAPVAGSSQ